MRLVHAQIAICAVAGLAGLAASASFSQEPPATGEALVQARCGSCHAVSRIDAAGYDLAGWRNSVATMINLGAKLTPAEAETVARYLAETHPAKAAGEVVGIPGPVKVSFKEWAVPTAGSRPHDPLITADGMLWYTGQAANVLGRVDPRTGAIKEFALPDKSGPHGLVADRAGAIWYTGNSGAHVGKLDPATGKVTTFPMPDPAARDPHTPIFDKYGILWFTVQGADMVGRLDPASGEVKLVKASPRSRPYGIVVSSTGTPFFDLFGTNKLGSIDPKTLAIREYPLPNAASRPRRIAITPDDMVWYTDFSRGFLGRLDPKTGAVTEWASPGGAASQPYAIAPQGDIVWYVESNTKPNMLVRFDPKTTKFQTWPIPAGGGVVRHMVATADGKLGLAESGVNQVALVTIER
jgi:virginiamycin B lyase